LVPENEAAVLFELASNPGTPNVAPPYVPGFAPALSAAIVPDNSLSRQ